MAVRAIVVADPIASIKTLTPWVSDNNANVRRFASEANRPRGVWAASIPLLRKEPHHALPIIDELRFDAERYVEDSVANWLNDAAKDQPGWVKDVLGRWEHDGVADRLIQRAARSLKTCADRVTALIRQTSGILPRKYRAGEGYACPSLFSDDLQLPNTELPSCAFSQFDSIRPSFTLK